MLLAWRGGVIYERGISLSDHLVLQDWVQGVKDKFIRGMKEVVVGVPTDVIVQVLCIQHVL